MRIKYLILYICLLFFYSKKTLAQCDTINKRVKFNLDQFFKIRPFINKSDTLKIIVGGDVMLHKPQLDRALKDGKYDFYPTFKYLEPIFRQHDIVILNFETTLSYNNFSGYPQFRSPVALVEALFKSGVTHVVTANNHTCDSGKDGIVKTIEGLDSMGIKYTGSFVNRESYIKNTPLYIEKNGFKLALLNYTYGTNGIKVPSDCVVPHIDSVLVTRDIITAKLNGATNIMTFFHWGDEYSKVYNSSQKRFSDIAHNNGSDLVIGSHPHVIQPIEYTTVKGDTTAVTIYSLGNLVSNQQWRYSNGGILASITLIKDTYDNISYKFEVIPVFVYKGVIDNEYNYYILNRKECDIYITNKHEWEKSREFFDDTDKLLGL